MERLLRDYSETVPEERLFSESQAADLRARLAETAAAEACEDSRSDENGAASVGAPPAATRSFARKLIPAGIAAVVLFALSIPLWWGSPAGGVALAVDGAFQKRDLFGTSPTVRGPGSDEQLFYVGVRTSEAAFVRIVAVDTNGSPETIPLDTQGRLTVELPADHVYTFGGYEVRSVGAGDNGADVTYFVVIASERAFDADEFERARRTISRRIVGIERDRVPDRLRTEFADRLGAAVKVVAVPSD